MRLANAAYFQRPPQNPLEAVGTLYDGRPLLLPPEMGAVVIGAGRVGYGFSRMMARVPGNSDSLVMVLPSDIPTWYELATQNRNSRRLPPDFAFNPDGEKRVHILPPRDIFNKMSVLQRMVEHDSDRWQPVLGWAAEQIKNQKVLAAADYWLASAQFQALTTRVGALSTVVDEAYIKGLHPEEKYILLHAMKSMAPSLESDSHPFFGHELLQALLRRGGRGDLEAGVVASAGYWVETTVAEGVPIRIRLTSTESEEIVQKARDLLMGPGVSVTTQVGRDAVFVDQYGGVIKNMIANAQGFAAVGMTAAIAGDPDYDTLNKQFEDSRRLQVREYQDLAARAMLHEGIVKELTPVIFPTEVKEDIFQCSRLDWPQFIAQANQLGLLELRERSFFTLLESSLIESYREGLRDFVRTAPATSFGTTNSTFAMVFGLATLLQKAGFIQSYRELMDPSISTPEGIRAQPQFYSRFRPARIGRGILRATRPFRLLSS